MIVSDWELSSTASSGVLARMAPAATPVGVVGLDFLNRRSGAWEHFDAKLAAVFGTFSPGNSWIPGLIPIPGLPKHGGGVLAKSTGFSISAISKNYGAIFVHDGWSGSLATICFSTWPPLLPYAFLYGIFALTLIVVPNQLVGKLTTSVLPFWVD
jgi:hypothetical protein